MSVVILGSKTRRLPGGHFQYIGVSLAEPPEPGGSAISRRRGQVDLVFSGKMGKEVSEVPHHAIIQTLPDAGKIL
jgi:hypothetical protein